MTALIFMVKEQAALPPTQSRCLLGLQRSRTVGVGSGPHFHDSPARFGSPSLFHVSGALRLGSSHRTCWCSPPRTRALLPKSTVLESPHIPKLCPSSRRLRPSSPEPRSGVPGAVTPISYGEAGLSLFATLSLRLRLSCTVRGGQCRGPGSPRPAPNLQVSWLRFSGRLVRVTGSLPDAIRPQAVEPTAADLKMEMMYPLLPATSRSLLCHQHSTNSSEFMRVEIPKRWRKNQMGANKLYSPCPLERDEEDP
ncbi:uncharacterized protein LOC141552886 [Sminthopsis crassicaudata]|uniref:uncharacterized protein LOC141552886 n=1 Tax=Sminthopsis crassicaudata TaxID=9301 RepID=UPI003D6981EB